MKESVDVIHGSDTRSGISDAGAGSKFEVQGLREACEGLRGSLKKSPVSLDRMTGLNLIRFLVSTRMLTTIVSIPSGRIQPGSSRKD